MTFSLQIPSTIQKYIRITEQRIRHLRAKQNTGSTERPWRLQAHSHRRVNLIDTRTHTHMSENFAVRQRTYLLSEHTFWLPTSTSRTLRAYVYAATFSYSTTWLGGFSVGGFAAVQSSPAAVRIAVNITTTQNHPAHKARPNSRHLLPFVRQIYVRS